MRIYQYVMIAKMVLADKPTNKESESESESDPLKLQFKKIYI